MHAYAQPGPSLPSMSSGGTGTSSGYAVFPYISANLQQSFLVGGGSVADGQHIGAHRDGAAPACGMGEGQPAAQVWEARTNKVGRRRRARWG